MNITTHALYRCAKHCRRPFHKDIHHLLCAGTLLAKHVHNPRFPTFGMDRHVAQNPPFRHQHGTSNHYYKIQKKWAAFRLVFLCCLEHFLQAEYQRIANCVYLFERVGGSASHINIHREREREIGRGGGRRGGAPLN